ncbi:Pimeloyl-ACP methyl ester carboxylesterase [Geodermatophilus dictyosporus]|uniref:Pimeloyl-ACP methyl ester carboxylesterase n=1 Tax=Geodermatophilus dictyosporus TaxID=1523247 RepID=A0A1I5S685_9ACTN|nr:alpha/beta fold hydrolase [Geodermatophilus dictyosporus]SFP66194.1 Pimeloyl-ACP methyl ester carboxylesterase [Geodermatophilus dictyosporus]
MGDRQAAFEAAYDAALARWPVPVRPVDVGTRFGSTHVLVSGAAAAPPLVLLPGGGATALAWSGAMRLLAAVRRVHVLDPVGDAGRSPATTPLTSADDVVDWLGEVLDGLGLGAVDLAGHSYGGWQALAFALDRPGRVRRLGLVDPTTTFGGFSAGYLLHAVPVLTRPTAARVRALVRWETGGRPVDDAWLDVAAAGAELPAAPPARTRRPDPARLRALTVPTLVVVAGDGRAQDPRQVARRAGQLVPRATVVTLPGATHHTLPAGSEQVLTEFLR